MVLQIPLNAHQWAKHYDSCVTCGTTERKHDLMGFAVLALDGYENNVRAIIPVSCLFRCSSSAIFANGTLPTME
jgi:hypothetical protein